MLGVGQYLSNVHKNADDVAIKGAEMTARSANPSGIRDSFTYGGLSMQSRRIKLNPWPLGLRCPLLLDIAARFIRSAGSGDHLPGPVQRADHPGVF